MGFPATAQEACEDNNTGNTTMNVIVTGGAGYIGSHTCLELLNAGYDVTVLDNLCNASQESIRRVELLTGKAVTFHEVDLCDLDALRKVFNQTSEVTAVIHFAGLKAVGESVQQPLRYYRNNLDATLNLCQVMGERGVTDLVFSSSATVYGDPASVPIREDFPLSCTNPYGRTKLMIEEILRDLHTANPQWNVVLLRYFNPVGAHGSGRIGEDPNGIPNNLVPYIAQVAIGKLPELSVFGNDYSTPDGTGVRDYIHVVDLALGHLRALERLRQGPGVAVYNLGTGRGYSVLEMISTFARVSGQPIPYRIVDRRPGDIAQCYADATLARQELGWQAQYGLEAMCEDTWRWQSANPEGYRAP
jgi:UDP-glucose 4-epimerase